MTVCLMPPLLTAHLVSDADAAYGAHLLVDVPQVAVWQHHLSSQQAVGENTCAARIRRQCRNLRCIGVALNSSDRIDVSFNDIGWVRLASHRPHSGSSTVARL